jgi:hypothetical protein
VRVLSALRADAGEVGLKIIHRCLDVRNAECCCRYSRLRGAEGYHSGVQDGRGGVDDVLEEGDRADLVGDREVLLRGRKRALRRIDSVELLDSEDYAAATKLSTV